MQDIDNHLNRLISKYENAWQKGYAAFPSVLAKHGLIKGVEVGVAFGGHSGAILEQGGVEKLFGVDSYKHRADYDDPMNLPQPVFDRLAQRVVERLKPFGDRFELIRKESIAASQDFEDGALDFVYLDADHSEAGVLDDLCHWVVKVREGGIVAGHDYGHRDFPGVKRAVDRYFARFGWSVNELGNGVWWVQRQTLPISFFSPCYNCADWIGGTARSVLEGNFMPGDEYVLVNDGSKDGTADALASLAEDYPGVRVAHHPVNRGGGAARNTAVGLAKHRLLVCLDSDNQLPSGLLQSFRRHLLCSDAEVLVPQTIRFFKDEDCGNTELTESHNAQYPVGRSGFADYLGGRCGGHAPASGGNLLFTRGAYDRASGFPNDSGALDAWGFGLRLAGTDAAIDVVDGTFYWHRCGHDSYWTRHNRQGTMGLAATELIRPFIHRVHPGDRRYLLGPGKDRWYFERGKRRFRTADPSIASNSLTFGQSINAMRYRWSPCRKNLGKRDTSRLRLILGVGRSGTSWTHKVLAQCDGSIRAFAEPLHHLRPKLSTSNSPDRLAMGFADALPSDHPLLRAYSDLSSDGVPKLDNAPRVVIEDTTNPSSVLIKEVHALLATPALLKATGGKAVVLTRDPMRVADSIFDCQGLDSPYLHHEADACGDTRLLSWIGTPEQTSRRLQAWQSINGQTDEADRRVLSTIWSIAIVQEVLTKTAERLPDQVQVMSYEQAKAQPIQAFGQAADHLGLAFGEQAKAFCQQTQSRDESADPYSIYRSSSNDQSWRVLTHPQREQAMELLRSGELTSDFQPAAEPIRRTA